MPHIRFQKKYLSNSITLVFTTTAAGHSNLYELELSLHATLHPNQHTPILTLDSNSKRLEYCPPSPIISVFVFNTDTSSHCRSSSQIPTTLPSFKA